MTATAVNIRRGQKIAHCNIGGELQLTHRINAAVSIDDALPRIDPTINVASNRKNKRRDPASLEASHFRLVFLVFSTALLVSSPSAADCVCPPNSVEDSVLTADRVFEGRVVSANMRSIKSKSIEFVVAVDETIRGTPEEEHRLLTLMPAECGVPVRLGFRDMYILQPGNQHVSNCSGSGRERYEDFPMLDIAIALVDNADSDVDKVLHLLNKRFYSSYERSTVETFFELVMRIDPLGYPITRWPDRIEYRGIVVYFENGKFRNAVAQR